MPNPINENRPRNIDYKHGKSTAAAYRPSISLKEAANKIKQSERGAALKQNGWKFTSRLKDIILDRKHYRSKFNTNPWVGNKGAGGKEYTVEDQKWRLVSLSTNGQASEWFLAHHVGAHNDFECWHISNTSGLRGARQPPPAQQQPAAQPAVAFDIVDDHNGDTMEILLSDSAPDNWEDLL